jgi:hypothetical protein
MPRLYYTTDKFEDTLKKEGYEDFSADDVLAHAMSVGDASIYSDLNDLNVPHLKRPNKNLELRKCLTQNGLEDLDENKEFQRNHYFDFLDNSEKSAISYNLGMAQCSMMATRLLNAKVTVHLDAVYALIHEEKLGKNRRSTPKGKRPDLLAYTEHPNGLRGAKFILEAKGRSGSDIGEAISEARKQFSSIPEEIQEISRGAQEIISVSYFKIGTNKKGAKTPQFPSWKNHLEAVSPTRPPEPPEYGKGRTRHTSIARSDSDQTDDIARSDNGQTDNNDEFAGLLLIAQLWPFVQMISTSPKEKRSRFSKLLHIAVDPRTGDYFGVPEEIYSLIKEEVRKPLVNKGRREKVARKAWDILKNLDISEVRQSVEASTDRATILPSGLIYVNLSTNAKSSTDITITKTDRRRSTQRSRTQAEERKSRKNSKRADRSRETGRSKMLARGFNRREKPLTLEAQQQGRGKLRQKNSNNK